MNLLALALIKKAVDQQSHHRSSSSKKSSGSSEKRYTSSSSHSYSLTEVLEASPNNYSSSGKLKNCVYNIIQSTTELKAVVDSHIEKLEAAKQRRVAELNAELETYCEPSAVISEKYATAVANLNGIGFNARVVGDSDSDYGKFWYVKPNPAGPHAAYYTAPHTLVLNGVVLDKQTFESGQNPFEIELAKYIQQHPTFKQDYDSLMAEIESLEKRKLALFLSSSKKEELAALRQKFESVKAVYDKVGEYAENIEKYKNLTPEQKEKLAQYFAAQEEFKTLSDAVLLSRSKSLQITGYGKPSDVQDLIEQSKSEAFDALTPEEQQALDVLPSTVASIVLSLDDEAFNDYTRGSYYYYGDSFYPSREVNEALIKSCTEKTREQYQLQKANAGSASQPGE